MSCPWVVKNGGQPHFFHHIGTAWRGDVESPWLLFTEGESIGPISLQWSLNPTPHMGHNMHESDTKPGFLGFWVSVCYYGQTLRRPKDNVVTNKHTLLELRRLISMCSLLMAFQSQEHQNGKYYSTTAFNCIHDSMFPPQACVKALIEGKVLPRRWGPRWIYTPPTLKAPKGLFLRCKGGQTVVSGHKERPGNQHVGAKASGYVKTKINTTFSQIRGFVQPWPRLKAISFVKSCWLLGCTIQHCCREISTFQCQGHISTRWLSWSRWRRKVGKHRWCNLSDFRSKAEENSWCHHCIGPHLLEI